MSNAEFPQVKAVGSIQENTTNQTKENNLNEETKKQIENWISYTHYLASFAGFLQLAYAIIINKGSLDKTTQNKIEVALHVVYLAVQKVNEQFVEGISSMKNGTEPKHKFDEQNIPDWPQNKDIDIFKAGWQMIKPILDKCKSNVAKGSVFESAILGLINAGDDCVDVIATSFLHPEETQKKPDPEETQKKPDPEETRLE